MKSFLHKNHLNSFNQECLFLILIFIPIFLLTGCWDINILNPLFEDEQIIFAPWLLGNWTEITETNEKTKNKTYLFVSFEKGKEKTYLIRFETVNSGYDSLGNYFKNYDTLRMEGSLGRLGKNLFLDMILADNAFGNNNQPGSGNIWLIRSHVFFKVVLDDSLRLKILNQDWLEQNLKSEQLQLKYSEFRSGTQEMIDENLNWIPKPLFKKAITATTKEIQKFIIKFGENEEVFKPLFVLSK